MLTPWLAGNKRTERGQILPPSLNTWGGGVLWGIREWAATQHNHQLPSIHHLPPSGAASASSASPYIIYHTPTGSWNVCVCICVCVCLIGLFLLICFYLSSAVHNWCCVKNIKHLTAWVLQVKSLWCAHNMVTRQHLHNLHLLSSGVLFGADWTFQ